MRRLHRLPELATRLFHSATHPLIKSSLPTHPSLIQSSFSPPSPPYLRCLNSSSLSVYLIFLSSSDFPSFSLRFGLAYFTDKFFMNSYFFSSIHFSKNSLWYDFNIPANVEYLRTVFPFSFAFYLYSIRYLLKKKFGLQYTLCIIASPFTI